MKVKDLIKLLRDELDAETEVCIAEWAPPNYQSPVYYDITVDGLRSDDKAFILKGSRLPDA